jgi:glycine/D-amino acid oxidase-like deaminating enzyme
MIVLISDFFADLGSTLKGLRMLRQRGHDVLTFHVLDDDEVDFPFAGPTRFEGLETEQHLNCNPRALRDNYLQLMQRFLDDIRHGCAQHGIDYALVRTSNSLDVVLASYLSNRLGMHHKN